MKIKITAKLLFVFTLIGILPLLLIGMISIKNSSEALKKEAISKLEVAQSLKKRQLEDYYTDLYVMVNTTKKDPIIEELLMEFDFMFQLNGNQIGSAEYDYLSKKWDPYFVSFCDENRLYDVFLINNDGYLVYTMAKEGDLGLTLEQEPLNTSGIGKAYQNLHDDPFLEISINDFEDYYFSNGDDASFIMTEVKSIDSVVIGYFAVQIASERINSITQLREGMGKTGESYLIGKTNTGSFLRSDRVAKSGKIGDPKSDEFIELALDGKAGLGDKVGSTGEHEIVLYTPLNIAGLNWGMITTISEAEALASVKDLKTYLLYTIIACLIVVVLIGIGFSISLTRPIKMVAEGARRLALGDTVLEGMDHSQIEKINNRSDELGDIGKNFVNLIAYLSEQSHIASEIGNGNFDIDITPKSDEDELSKSMNNMKQAISGLNKDILTLTTAAEHDRLDVRADSSKHKGEFGNILSGVNGLLNIIGEKIFYYEAILDSVQYPISVTDLDMNWTFFNKAVADLTKLDREKMRGAKCSNWNADICNTEKCGIAMMKKGNLNSFFKQPGVDKDFRVDTTWLKNAKGDKIGHIEIIQDITKDVRVKEYDEIEVSRVARNLELLANGDVNFDTDITPPTEYTQVAYENFLKINNSLNNVQNVIQNVITDQETLVNAALNGDVQVRADASKHTGSFFEIVDGLNKTLDAVIDPITEVMTVMEATANKDLTARVTGLYKGQLQEFTSNVNKALQALEASISLVVASTNNLNIESDELNIVSSNLASGSEEMTAQSTAVAASAEEISHNVADVTSTTELMSKGVSTIAAASEEMATGVNTVASAIEELTSSLQEVSSNTVRASSISSDATTNAESANNIMGHLKDAANEIGKVVEVISDIADQTNLLALNATIEAASAGEAGKGFAVVANEVKELAKQTAQATEEITDQIQNMQDKTDLAVKSIIKISEIISEINNITNVIATAVEEQTSTTNEISRSVAGAAAGANEVSSKVTDLNIRIDQELLRAIKEADIGVQNVSKAIIGINEAAGSVSSEASTTNLTAGKLGELSTQLMQAVGEFKLNVNQMNTFRNAA